MTICSTSAEGPWPSNVAEIVNDSPRLARSLFDLEGHSHGSPAELSQIVFVGILGS